MPGSPASPNRGGTAPPSRGSRASWSSDSTAITARPSASAATGSSLPSGGSALDACSPPSHSAASRNPSPFSRDLPVTTEKWNAMASRSRPARAASWRSLSASRSVDEATRPSRSNARSGSAGSGGQAGLLVQRGEPRGEAGKLLPGGRDGRGGAALLLELGRGGRVGQPVRPIDEYEAVAGERHGERRPAPLDQPLAVGREQAEPLERVVARPQFGGHRDQQPRFAPLAQVPGRDDAEVAVVGRRHGPAPDDDLRPGAGGPRPHHRGDRVGELLVRATEGELPPVERLRRGAGGADLVAPAEREEAGGEEAGEQPGGGPRPGVRIRTNRMLHRGRPVTYNSRAATGFGPNPSRSRIQ